MRHLPFQTKWCAAAHLEGEAVPWQVCFFAPDPINWLFCEFAETSVDKSGHSLLYFILNYGLTRSQ